MDENPIGEAADPYALPGGKIRLSRRKLFGRERGVKLARPGRNAPTLLVLLLVAIHLMVILSGGVYAPSGFPREVYFEFGLSWEGVRHGMVWQLLSHAFLHGSWSHLLLNCVLLYYGGARLSHILGPGFVLRLFLLGTLVGGVIHVLAQASIPSLPTFPLVGASGGVWALMLGLCGVAPDSRMLFLNLSARNLGRGVLLSAFFLFMMTPGVPLTGQLGVLLQHAGLGGLFQIANLYHFAAGMTGLWWASHLYGKPVSLEDLKRQRVQREQKNNHL